MTDSLENILPHKAPMILIDRVMAHTEESIHTQLTIREGLPFYEEGVIPSYIGIEYMAQSIAAWNGLILLKEQKPPRVGFLLGARKLSLAIPAFTEGMILDIHGNLNFHDGEMASFSCWIESMGEKLSSATLNVFQPSDITKGDFIP